MKMQDMVVTSSDRDLEPQTYPRFDRCSAPNCPIDPGLWDTVHRKGESICLYLRLRAKSPIWDLKAGRVPREIIQRIEEVYPEILSRCRPIKRALEKIAQSPQKRFTQGEGQ